ncbi:Acyl-CoA dehydrogenase [bacterium HR26]|nr:Acyl-CoA dehydrogenase [bacterium HR26]
MDFEFTEDQVMLRGLVREFLSEQCPVSHVRAMMEHPRGYDRDLYRRLVQLGMLPFPEKYGGAGLGMIEQAIVLEEMGRIPYPGPYFATVILAGGAIMASGDSRAQMRYLPAICNGDLAMSLAFLEDGISWGPDAIGLSMAREGESYRLDGIKRFVPFGQSVDDILVVARSGGGRGAEGISLVAVPADAPGLVIEPEVMMDLTSKTATLRFEGVRVPAENRVGPEGGAWPAVEVALRQAAVGASAEMLGAARKALEMSVDYAKVRKQFGQYIGQFQAIKHKLAEMLELVENAHAAVYYAAWALDAGAPDAALAASVAKSTVNVAARRVCGDAIQVHGGIGFTWEYDLHLYFKRAKHLEPLYGDTEYHRERVLQEALAGRVAGSA